MVADEFEKYCPDWKDEQFTEAETLVSGIEYATIMTTGDSAPIDMRITGALNNILMLYQVPEEIRRKKIQRVLAMDYVSIGCAVLQDFLVYIGETTEQAFEELLNGKEQGFLLFRPTNPENVFGMMEKSSIRLEGET